METQFMLDLRAVVSVLTLEVEEKLTVGWVEKGR